MKTKVVNVKREPYDIYIGRAGKGQDGYFGNPVAVGKVCPECGVIHRGGGSTLNCYKKYLIRRIKNDKAFKARMLELEGKTLGCFCKPVEGFGNKLMCHGQVLALTIEEVKKGIL